MTRRDRWDGRRVLITGHTGFKGAWLTAWLEHAGAQVTGVALDAATGSLHADVAPHWRHRSIVGDLRTTDLSQVVAQSEPQVVFHLAAQAIVRDGYRHPELTWATNVMGTVRLLEALRTAPSLEIVVTSTTDKVYGSAPRAFVESDPLIATDPYSGSKVGQEAVVASYAHSFFADGAQVVTARAGNVVGGGDDGTDRLIPDAVRAHRAGRTLELRYPDAVRPWQHVLEPLSGYLALAEHALVGESVPAATNFGPEPTVATVAEVAERFSHRLTGDDATLVAAPQDGDLRESRFLALDASAAGVALGWKPRLTLDETITWTADWYRDRLAGADPLTLMLDQIDAYEERLG